MADHKWTPIDDRVVEIKVPLADDMERLGTGFVAAPNRILTALHVILGRDAMRADARIASPTKILVRTLGDFRRRFGDTRDVLRDRGFERLKAKAKGDYLWRPATLLWPTPNSEIPRFEFAVLEAEADEEVLATLRSSSMSCAWPVEEARCRGCGFASWNRIKIAQDVTITEVAPIRGRIEPATGRIQSLQSLTIESATPPKSDEWQGLSGAALFDEWHRLLGIVSTTKQTAQNSGLGVSLLADIAESSEFEEFWTASCLTKPIADQPGRMAVDVGIPECPYPGLTHFTSNDAHLFFGRDRTVERLVAAVNRRSLTALVGPSGSGKSSVVLAGLAPRLHQGGKGSWQFSSFRMGADPDRDPFVALARALAALGANPSADPHELARDLESGDRTLRDVLSDCRDANPAKRILLIADQFEEIFTLVDNEARRNRFIDVLLSGFPSSSDRPTVALILTLRADFYGFALRHQPQSADRPPLSDVLQDCVENLGPMNREELRACIEKPARLRGVSLEPGLADTLLGEVESQAGLLPLLEFALREMWSLQANREITYAAHWSIEGVKGALAKRAELIFERKTDNQTDKAATEVFRRLVTRLVNAGEGQQDTRRVARRHELGDQAWKLAQDLAGEENRLVVTNASEADRETVELAHEALIHHWPRLVKWIEDDRDFQYWLRQIRPAVQLWSVDRNDDAPLLRGRMLAEASGWLESRRSDCSADEIAFIEASAALQRRVDAEKEATRQAEIERQQHLAVSQSLRLAITARSVIDTAPETALLLAGEAMRHDWNPVSDEILRETLELTQAQVVSLSTPEQPVIAATFDAAGNIFTLSRGGHACRFDVDGRLSSDFRIEHEQLVCGALRPDGEAYLAVAADGTAQLYKITGEKVAVLPAWKEVKPPSRPMIRWSPDGHHALCIDGDGAWLWSIGDRHVSAPWDNRQPYKKLLSQLHESRSAGRIDEQAALRAQLDRLYEEGHLSCIFDAAISPDGKMVATASRMAQSSCGTSPGITLRRYLMLRQITSYRSPSHNRMVAGC